MTNTNEIQMRECASFLYDGGWRKGDAEQLVAEYGIPKDEADAICEVLEEFENREA